MTRTRRPNQSTPSVAATQVETSAQPTRHGLPITGTLRLRAEATTTEEEAPAEERRIRWAEDVVDNEGQGKKSSKVCCIYHKPRAVGESSSESDSSESDSSESDSDSGVDNGEARMANGRSSKRRLHKHHDHNHDDDSHSGHNRKPAKRKPKVNAYERVPKHNTKKAEDTQRQT